MCFKQPRPVNLGVRDGKLAPCPNKPNCVNSQSSSARHRVEPLRYDGSPAQAMAAVREVLAKLPRVTVVEAGERYLHAECRTPVMGFIDDLEFYCDESTNTMHLRSASRLGYWDLGVNARRIEAIRKRLHQQGKTVYSKE